MKFLHYSQVLLVSSIFLLSATAAQAKICTAKPSGAKSSITFCMNKVKAGDVILLKPGVYRDQAAGGNERFPIEMKAGVTVTGHGASNTRVVTSDGHAFVGDSAGVVIEDVTIASHNGAGVWFTAMSTADGVLIRNADFVSTGMGRSGVNIDNNTKSVVVEGCNFTGPNWDLSVNPGTGAAIKEVRVIDSAFTDNSGGSGEAPIGINNVLKLVIRNVEIHGWPDTFQITASQVLIDNLDIADNSTFYIASMQGHTAQALIRNSRIGFNVPSTSDTSTYFRGNAETWVFNSQLIEPVRRALPIELKLLNCYQRGLGAISDL